MANTEAEIKVTSDASEEFLTAYYRAISRLDPLGHFYVSSSERYAGVIPDISINGLANLTPAQYETMLAEQSNPPPSTVAPDPFTTTEPTPSGDIRATAQVSYTFQAFDTQIANPSFALGDPPPLVAPGGGGGWRPGRPGRGARRAGGGGGGGSADGVADAAAVGQRASILVQVSGKMQFGREEDAPEQSFSEVFVLVPNWDAMVGNVPPKTSRWLIMSQNFRAL